MVGEMEEKGEEKGMGEIGKTDGETEEEEEKGIGGNCRRNGGGGGGERDRRK